MGNAHTKEARDGTRLGGSHDAGGSSAGAGHLGDSGERAGRRSGRPELTALGLLTGSGSGTRGQGDAPFERRETKQEREARRLERERVARLKERERSMREENVDGGFLVTMGVYTASEDFNKPIVRQLQIERKIAPFWRGLDDFDTSWAEHQIVAAARGLDIPPADEVPDDLLLQPRPPESPSTSSQNLNNLTVPLGPRTLSAASDKTASNPGSSLPSPTSPAPPKISSPMKPHRKAFAAALSISSRNGSQQDITPREIFLPNDPFVNGQPLEVFLYKDGIECPICCLYYPRYLNKTRCCDQLICSECFVQIKRPDPHLPEHHPDQQNTSENIPVNPDESTAELIMEPACCPYCTQTEFGVIYEPPPFRRGLTYTFGQNLGSMGTAMSSTSSLNSNLSPTSATTPINANRRRAQSLSANAPGVISTDRIRPDWSSTLATVRAQQRRRAAAADALHHAAFVMGNNESTRSLFGRSSRFGRRNTGPGNDSQSSIGTPTADSQGPDLVLPTEPGPRSSSARTGPSRDRIDAAHLESMMMAEAIRLSLADEEERRRKAEKEAKKDAKKKEKEDRKTNKRKSSVYGGSEGASSSSLSLRLGRARGNSAAGSQSLRAEASVAAAAANAGRGNDESPADSSDKGKAVDRSEDPDASPSAASQSSTVATLPIPITQPSRGSSHLRQMSNASSVSSGVDSAPGSYASRNHGGEDPSASGLSLGGGKSEDEGAGTESMFNFRSLAQMVGVPIDGEELSADPDNEGASQARQSKGSADGSGHHEHVEHAEHVITADRSDMTEKSEAGECSTTSAEGAGVVESGKPPILDTNHMGVVSEGSTEQENRVHSSNHMEPPSVMITPETPAPLSGGEEESKQLGHTATVERPNEVTQ